MRKLFVVISAVVAGLAVAGIATAARNSSGTYSLPSSYNPVTSNSTITSNWANNTLNDLATEVTDSLDRSGKGGMLAVLKGVDGTVAAPAFSFTNEPGTGIYRIGASDLACSVNGTKVQEWTGSTTTFPLAVTVTGALTANGGETVAGTLTANGGETVAGTLTANGGQTASTTVTNGSAITATGNGTGPGITATGGSGGATAGSFTGTGSSPGVTALGGPTNGVGVNAAGQGTGAGGTFANGTAATGGTRRAAITLTNGDLAFVGVTDATSTTALSNRLVPKTLVKAWADISFNSTTTPTVNDGASVASVSANTTSFTVTFAQAFANTNYSVVATPSMLSTTVCGPYVLNGKTTTTATFNTYQTTIGAPANIAAHPASTQSTCAAEVIAIGAQ